ncbi:sensor histidine kinase [Sinisalibacter lacisalsi]|uniref:histidine kinase n=1 Tax=Sinisalibacter lacisalsi TaxID=1526570 RepID=A0ABQ1QHR7_9RHOB|nr:HAMP domain-containing sensor histidine kinase [Sinisalibacter lacisalsi]GGD27946.1 hypothetical protein GCM10011358_10200 [Sinisalibacter lacisalsi]
MALFLPYLPLLLICFGPLAFALAKTSALERDMRIAVTENMLWVVTQTQKEVMALTLAAAAPDRQAEEIAQSFDLAVSRLTLLGQGPQQRYLAELGHADTLQQITTRILALDPEVQGHGPAQHAAIYEQGLALQSQFNRLANDVMMQEWEIAAERLDTYRSTQTTVIFAVAFAFLGAMGISWLFLRNKRRLNEAEIQRRRDSALLQEARDTSEMYRDFAAMVSHQMRTPLSLIDSAMHRLARRGDAVTASDVAERQGVVQDAVRRMTRLVETVLLVGKLDNRQVRGNLAPAALDALAQSALTEARGLHPGRDIRLSSTGSRIMALCDPLLVAHILENLLANALRYSPVETRVELRVFSQGGQVACAVTDQGPGIAPADQPHVFKRYFRGEAHRAEQGTGLGLALARELAELQGGRIGMDTWPGRGSVFTLWLPAASEGRP